MQYSSDQPPNISQQPADITVTVGSTVQFHCSATGATPLNYQWQRNGSDINGSTSPTLAVQSVQLSDSGAKFRCVVTNTFGSAQSREALLTVSENSPPMVTITKPIAGSQFTAGQTIAFAGSATDPDEGMLPASNLTWQVDLHHDEHTHPFIAPFSGESEGTFVVPTEGHTEPNIWYRVHLTAVDSQGAEATTYVDILPNQIMLTVDTAPSGLSIDLDGQPQQTPTSGVAVAGVIRQLTAPLQQTVNNTLYALWGWSDGGAADHMITTPSIDTTYTAIYAAVTIPQSGFASIPNPDTTVDLGAGGVGIERVIYMQVLSNNTSDITIESATISGDGADVFGISGVPIALVAGSGALAQLPITCIPTAVESYTATLTLNTTDPNQATVNYPLKCAGVIIQDTPPNAPETLSAIPNQGRPTLTWHNDHLASWYNLWIGNENGTVHYEWYPVNPADEVRVGINLPTLACAGLTCTLKPDINPFSGTYQVWLRSWGSGGYSTGGETDYDGWSTTSFTLPDTPPGEIAGITQTIASGKVTMYWQGASNATWYNVWLGTAPNEWTVRFFDWVLAESVNCENGGQCVLSSGISTAMGNVFDGTLVTDEYIVYIRAWGPGGFGTGGIEGSGWYEGEMFTFP